jgi:DNA polymerase I-like protein with 3'-5' exonuclease and polymerase domains
MYRLAVIGESQAQLNSTTLREWLNRAGFKVSSGWGPKILEEDVWFGELFDPAPKGVPQLALGGDIAEALTGYKLPALKVRGSLLPRRDGGWVTVTIRPEDVNVSKGQDHLKPHLGGDARRAIETSTPKIPIVKYRENPSGLGLAPPTGSVVSVDIEGSNGRPNIVGVSWSEEEAFVFPWSDQMRLWLTELFRTNVPTFHNASFDVAELEEAGVTPPKVWWDTIVMAALYDPSQPMNLQTQVLTHVPGSVAWKGLVNHEKGPDFEGGQVGVYRELWCTCLGAIRRGPLDVPTTGTQWYQFYNGLDTAWGLALANQFKRKLTAQGRWNYYTDVLMPLQQPLLQMGNEGMPLDLAKLGEHQENCQRWKEEARTIVMEVGQAVADGRPPIYSKAKTPKLKPPVPFNPDSPKQLGEILYDHYGLPVIRTPKRGRCVNENAIKDLTSRVTRGTAKVRGDKDECLKVLTAITAYNHWGHWLDTFLNPPIECRKTPRLITTYSLHRTITGRLTSGLDNSDLDKGGKRQRKVNLQNWPKELRDVVRAPEGYSFIGGDYSAIEWCIAMWFCAKEHNDDYHIDMLDRFYRGEFDPHSFLAEIAGCDRQVAKVFTHGYNYDGSPRTLARNAGLADSTGLRVCAAHDKAFRTRPWKEAVVTRAKKQHYIQTPLSWRCYNWAWQPKPSEVLAWLVQGTAADLCKWMMKSIFEGMPPDCRLVTSTHDSFLLQVPISSAQRQKEWLVEQMQQPINWLDNRQWRADVRQGRTWKDVS